MGHSLLTLAQQAQNNTATTIVLVVYLAILVLVVAGVWKVFEKAGEPGWAAIVPIYNLWVLVKISGRPWWWMILMFIPLVGIFAFLIISIDIAKSFGKGTGFGIGMWLLSPVFYPILGFGPATYQGPAAT